MTAAAPSAEIVSPPRDRPLVLLVVRETMARRALQLALEGEGFLVRAFGDADALLAYAGRCDAACLVTEGADGIGLLNAMRDGGWSRSAILMTDAASVRMEMAARLAGFSQILASPLHPSLLVRAVMRSVGMK